MNTTIDPSYYANNEDGSEPHGYWIKSADYESQVYWSKRLTAESYEAVKAGIACDLSDAPDYMPF